LKSVRDWIEMRRQPEPAQAPAATPMPSTSPSSQRATQRLLQISRLLRRLNRARAALMDDLDAVARESVHQSDLGKSSGFGGDVTSRSTSVLRNSNRRLWHGRTR
jgi:hypothetical protein